MKRRTFLQGMAACVAAIIAPIKTKADPWRLRCVIPTIKKYGGTAGDFDSFLNTPYLERISEPMFKSATDMNIAILTDREQVPHVLGEDKRQVYFKSGRKHDRRLRNQIYEAIKAHKPFASPFDGGAHTGA